MIRCRVYRSLLTEAVLNDHDPLWPISTHVDRCIKCQAHVASVRVTRRRLGDLTSEPIEVPSGLAQHVLVALDHPLEAIAARGRWMRAASASLVAALLAAVWVRRRATARV